MDDSIDDPGVVEYHRQAKLYEQYMRECWAVHEEIYASSDDPDAEWDAWVTQMDEWNKALAESQDSTEERE